MRTVEPGAGIWAPTLRFRAHEGKGNDRDGNNGGDVNGRSGGGRFYLAGCKWDRYRPKSDVSWGLSFCENAEACFLSYG
jgi:hypothetical protein